MRGSFKRLAVVGLALALLASAVPGGVMAQDSTSVSEAELDNLVRTYNANVDSAPSIARGRLAGETIEARFGAGDTIATKQSGDIYYFTTNEDGVIVDWGQEAPADATIRLRTSEETFSTIVNAENPAAEFDQQYENSNIRIGGISLTKSVEVELAKFGYWLAKTFGLV